MKLQTLSLKTLFFKSFLLAGAAAAYAVLTSTAVTAPAGLVPAAAAQSHQMSTPLPVSGEPTHVYTQAPEDHVIGDALAPHTLIVYASVVCGHCGRWFSNDYPIIKERLIDTGKLRLVFREFPTQPSEVAVYGFQIANCAPEERYFDALVHQFQTQDQTFTMLKAGEGRARFTELGKLSGLETEDEVLSCIKDPSGLKRIETSMQRAQAGKVDAVPALILDGALMPGLNGAKEVLDALGENTAQ